MPWHIVLENVCSHLLFDMKKKAMLSGITAYRLGLLVSSCMENLYSHVWARMLSKTLQFFIVHLLVPKEQLSLLLMLFLFAMHSEELNG